MKNNQKYFFVSFVTGLAVAGASLGTLGLAQAVVPLSCMASQTLVASNQATIFTAVGGNGIYTWSGANINVTNATSNQFAVSYPDPGVYTITVSSGGYSANCNMTVAGTVATGALVCSPGTQNVTLGQTASFTASGGNGSYTWSSPDLTINNATGSGFSASYASTGVKTMTVTSAGAVDTCVVNVLSNGVVTPPVVTPPGLPATGGGYGQQ